MSNTQPLHEAPDDGSLGLSISVGSLAAPLSAIAFWLAIAIPALYVPVFAAGIDGPTGLGLFLGLFGLHLLALFGGRSYRREST